MEQPPSPSSVTSSPGVTARHPLSHYAKSPRYLCRRRPTTPAPRKPAPDARETITAGAIRIGHDSSGLAPSTTSRHTRTSKKAHQPLSPRTRRCRCTPLAARSSTRRRQQSVAGRRPRTGPAPRHVPRTIPHRPHASCRRHAPSQPTPAPQSSTAQRRPQPPHRPISAIPPTDPQYSWLPYLTMRACLPARLPGEIVEAPATSVGAYVRYLNADGLVRLIEIPATTTDATRLLDRTGSGAKPSAAESASSSACSSRFP